MSALTWGCGSNKHVEHAWQRETDAGKRLKEDAKWDTSYTALCTRAPVQHTMPLIGVLRARRCWHCERNAKFFLVPEEELERMVGVRLVARWPRAMTLTGLTKVHKALKHNRDRLESIMAKMSAEGLAWRAEVGGWRRCWTARRKLMELNGRGDVYGRSA